MEKLLKTVFFFLDSRAIAVSILTMSVTEKETCPKFILFAPGPDFHCS